MAYNPQIPQATDQLSVSQGDILLNFQEISTFINVNHVDFNGADQGKHKFIQLPAQAVAPATAATEMALYTKNVLGIPQLFLRKSNNGPEVNFSSATAATTGEATLPSGIKLKWGQGTTAGTGLLTVNFASAFTTIFTAHATIATVGGVPNPNSNDRVIQIYDYTNALFSVVSYIPDTARTRSAANFTWFAIGV